MLLNKVQKLYDCQRNNTHYATDVYSQKSRKSKKYTYMNWK